MIDAGSLDAVAQAWSRYMFRGVFESAVLFVVIGGLWLTMRRRMSSHLAHWLFLLIPLKLILPLSVAVPASWFPAWETGTSIKSTQAPPRGGGVDVARSPQDPDRVSPALSSSPTVVPPVPGFRPGMSVASGLMIVWLGTGVVLLTTLLSRHAKMHVRLRSVPDFDAAGWPIDLSELSRRTGLRGPVTVKEVPWIDTPAVWGLVRPVLLVPPGLSETLTPGGLTWVILHEFAHIRRRDAWVVLLQRLVQVAYVFHPVVWLANRMIDQTREFACDDAALALAEVPRRDCGEGFLSILELARGAGNATVPALGIVRSHSLIRSRLMRLIDPRRPLPPRGLSAGGCGVLLIAAVVALPRLRADDRPDRPARPAPAPASAPASVPRPARPATPSRIASGMVRDRDGRPIAGATITGTERHHEVSFRNGELDGSDELFWVRATSGANGGYRFLGRSKQNDIPVDEPFGLFAVHPSGFARKSAEEIAASPDLVLEPWGRVVGSVSVMGRPAAGVAVRLSLDATDAHSMGYDFFDYTTYTDDQGRYAIEHVPAGLALVTTGPVPGNDPRPFGPLSSGSKPLRAGETLILNLGGTGRPVVGKLWILEGVPVNLGGGHLARKLGTPPGLPPLTEEQMKTWGQEKVFRYYFEDARSPEGLARRLAARFHPIQIQAGGTFRALDVEPGTYTVSFWSGQDSDHPLITRDVDIPAAPEGSTSEPFDMGTITITPPEK